MTHINVTKLNLARISCMKRNKKFVLKAKNLDASGGQEENQTECGKPHAATTKLRSRTEEAAAFIRHDQRPLEQHFLEPK